MKKEEKSLKTREKPKSNVTGVLGSDGGAVGHSIIIAAFGLRFCFLFLVLLPAFYFLVPVWSSSVSSLFYISLVSPWALNSPLASSLFYQFIPVLVPYPRILSYIHIYPSIQL